MRKTQMEYPKFPAILTSLSIPLVNSLKYPNVGFESTFTEILLLALNMPTVNLS